MFASASPLHAVARRSKFLAGAPKCTEIRSSSAVQQRTQSIGDPSIFDRLSFAVCSELNRSKGKLSRQLTVLFCTVLRRTYLVKLKGLWSARVERGVPT